MISTRRTFRLSILKLTPQTPTESHDIENNFGASLSGNWFWTMNGVSYRANYNRPTLLVTKSLKSLNFPENYNVYLTNPANDTTQVVMWHLKNEFPSLTQFHFHGHNMYLLAQGPGAWGGTVTSNPNPPRRDVYMLLSSGPLVFSYKATNSGVWPMHCHIAWHVATGLFIQTIEQSEWIQNNEYSIRIY